MNSTFLTSIENKLKELTTLKYIDEDWGQLDYYSPNFPVKWPCCLIDVTGAVFSDIGVDKSASPRNRQEGMANVSLTFASLKLTNSSAMAPTGQKTNSWALYGIMEDAHKLLQGFRPLTNSGGLVRSGFRRIKRDDGVQQYQVLYTIGLHNV